MNLIFQRLAWQRPAMTAAEAPESRRPVLALALACHKGDAKQDQTSNQSGAQTGGVNNTGNGTANAASGSGTVFQVTLPAGATSHTGSPANGWQNTYTQAAEKVAGTVPDTAPANAPAAAPAVANVQTGATALVGSGNTVTLTDAGAIQAALETVSKFSDTSAQTTAAALDKVSALAEIKAQDATTQKTQLTFAGLIVLAALGGLYAITRRKKA